MFGKDQKWRQNLKTPNSGKRTRGGGRGGGWGKGRWVGGEGDWVTGTEVGT